MRIAYIILCHKNPNQINHLVNELITKNSDVFLHIDLKSNIKDEIIKNKNVHILPKEESFSIAWGSVNMIKATLNLIKSAKKQDKNYDYICLLSGQDFPIVSQQDITNRLRKDTSINYINIVDKNTKEYSRYKKLYELWYPKWITKNNLFIKIIKRIYMILTGGFSYTFGFIKRKKPFNFDFEFGSQWWCLTSQCAYYILDYCDKHPEYIKYYENTIIPDECFFQTIFMHSPFNNNYSDNLTFVNWKDNRRSPETLTIQDYGKIKEKSKTKCFARKFDEEIDKEIIKKIKNKAKGE